MPQSESFDYSVSSSVLCSDFMGREAQASNSLCVARDTGLISDTYHFFAKTVKREKKSENSLTRLNECTYFNVSSNFYFTQKVYIVKQMPQKPIAPYA